MEETFIQVVAVFLWGHWAYAQLKKILLSVAAHKRKKLLLSAGFIHVTHFVRSVLTIESTSALANIYAIYVMEKLTVQTRYDNRSP